MILISILLLITSVKGSTRADIDKDKNVEKFGPPYPVTASWFRDRYTLTEWDQTLSKFKSQGGDTVFLRAPPIIKRTKGDLARDLNFIWCGSYRSSYGVGGQRCEDEAIEELTNMGLNVSYILSYQYEENFTDQIMFCPQYDRKINSSRIYYRLVLPAGNTTYSINDPCHFEKGSEVAVLFTSFAGTDPHELLVKSASNKNISVYFGLPGAPSGFEPELMQTYYAWVDRVLTEQKHRYSAYTPTETGVNSFYQTIVGYYGIDEVCLGEVKNNSLYIDLYKRLGMAVKRFLKLFAISPYVNLNRSQLNSTVKEHADGFLYLAKTRAIDIIAVQEGRGAAKGCYYWPHQINQPVKQSDLVLDKAIRYVNPNFPENVTFAQAFSSSNQQVFSALQKARNDLRKLPNPIQLDFWLNLEAFEYLRDDPCLPVDFIASGMGELLNRASKSRLDRGLSVSGAKVQKIISFAWDSDYLCTTKKFNTSLHDDIIQDLDRPIVANCSFDTPLNLSLVVLGFNLQQKSQSYIVEWTDNKGVIRVNSVFGSYFELDYGMKNDLVTSLQYVQLDTILEMEANLAKRGTVKISGTGIRDACYFDYDEAS